MSNVAIRVENLGKQYRIGGSQVKYKTLRDSITNAIVSPFQRAGALLRGQAYGAADLTEEIWALKDVSFEVKMGEVVGIIGRNGAGKSTLLKVLSRITEPTEGYADIYGRVGALLEVGTGFHHELTGRENIYLNSAILGMPRVEIDRKFDEIVSFAEVEKFIDTPVKHYSSGMRLRLGFSVAAHLEPEILVVDEVLAVGDAAFQKKCLGKMNDVASEGRTVLFVSHNMIAIQNLCSRTIWLNSGNVKDIGETEDIISSYLAEVKELAKSDLSQRTDRVGNGHIRFQRVWITDTDGNERESVSSGEAMNLMLEYKVEPGVVVGNLQVIVGIRDNNDQMLVSFDNDRINQPFDNLSGTGVLCCWIPSLPLVDDTYSVQLHAIANGNTSDLIFETFRLVVAPFDFYGTGKTAIKKWHGPLLLPYSWEKV